MKRRLSDSDDKSSALKSYLEDKCSWLLDKTSGHLDKIENRLVKPSPEMNIHGDRNSDDPTLSERSTRIPSSHNPEKIKYLMIKR